jgi:Zn-dependent membrane protease YugP
MIMFSPDYMIYTVLGIALSLVGMLISGRLKSKFEQYSQVGMRNGLTGKEIAESMLRYYNISDVQVVSVQGMLTDHYNPANKTVNLSEGVYNSPSVAAAAVASHECGHAVQHAEAYAFLKMRSAIVPAVKVASTANQILLPIALFMLGSFPSLMLICIIGLGITTIFSLITLPVEFDASRRALAWMGSSGKASGSGELEGAKDALWWAAMTYVAAALSSLVMLVFLILRYTGSRE